MLRFRPILMTTMAALLGALPLALGTGTGYELRRPLGITIVGGLILSQMLTLYTTPVVYLTFDRLRLRMQGKQHDIVGPPDWPSPQPCGLIIGAIMRRTTMTNLIPSNSRLVVVAARYGFWRAATSVRNITGPPRTPRRPTRNSLPSITPTPTGGK